MAKTIVPALGWLRGAAAGLIAGSLSVVITISCAALIYADTLPDHLGQGITMILIGTAVAAAVLALTSGYRGAIGIPQASPTVIIALMLAPIVAAMASTADSTLKYVTITAAILLATLLVGVMMLAFGTLRLGRLIRFIPYPVIGGFLAGTGWLLLRGGFGIMSGGSPTDASVSAYFQPEQFIQWGPGLLFALVLLAATRRSKHPLLVPLLVAGAVVLFYAALVTTGTSTGDASRLGLLLGPFPDDIASGYTPLPSNLASLDWSLILSQGARLVVVVIVCVISLLLNCSGLELASGQEIDFDRELKAAGLGNITSAFFGGLPSYHGLSPTLIGYMMQANSRVTGLTVAVLMALVGLAGNQILSLLPKAVLGGLVAFLGFSLLVEWLYDSWNRMPRADYFVVALILAVVTVGGYLEGVVIGVVAACILFLVEYSRQSVVKQMFTGETYRSTIIRAPDELRALQQLGHQILILQLHGYLFFGTANSLYEMIRQHVTSQNAERALRHLVLDFRQVSNLDSSAVLSFGRLQNLCLRYDISLVLTSLSENMAKRLKLDQAANRCLLYPEMDRGIEWCENRVLQDEQVTPMGSATSLQEHLQNIMGDQTAAHVLEYFIRHELAPGMYLVRQGDETTDLYFVESGLLSIQLELDAQTTIRVATATAGSVLGEISFYLTRARTASIVAEQVTTVFSLSPDALEQMRAVAPSAAAALHEYLARILSVRLSENVAALRTLLS